MIDKRYLKFAASAMVLAAILAFTPVNAYSSSKLQLDKTIFAVGEEIAVHFTAGPGFAENAWIGIIPSHVLHGSEAENDRNDMTYQYLKKMQGGTLIFRAPGQPGAYDFQMHDTDDNGKEVASVSFQVNR